MSLKSELRQIWSREEKLCYFLLTRKTPNPTPLSLLQIQSFLLRRSLLFPNIQLFTLLITSLASSISHFTHACRLFDLQTNHDAFLCNSMLLSYTRHNMFRESIVFYRRLRRECFHPNDYTFSYLLKSCAFCKREGIQVHTHVLSLGYCSDPYCATALIDFYFKSGEMACASKIFDELYSKSLIAWSMMVVGFAKCGDLNAAVYYFYEMPEKDSVVLNAMIDAYVKFGNINSARKLFDEMNDRNVVTWTTLICGYTKLGDMKEARALFDEMPFKNLFAWNSMIGGYCKNNQPNRALELFRELQSNACEFNPDDVTIVSIMPAISSMGTIDVGKWVHEYAHKNCLDRLANVSTSLLDMYFKCGEIEEARKIFDSFEKKQTIFWNAMISGLAINGQATEALNVFSNMIESKAEPNDVTMLGVLSACVHGGLLDEGRRYFVNMKDFKLEPKISHYGCMVDLYGRGGCLDEAEKLINTMPYKPNGVILSSLLFACVHYKDVERGERVMDMIQKVEPNNVRNYVMMRNLYANAKMWKDVDRIKETINQYGGKKEAGCSVIEVESMVWEFVSGDKSHPNWKNMCIILKGLELHMKGREEELKLLFGFTDLYLPHLLLVPLRPLLTGRMNAQQRLLIFA